MSFKDDKFPASAAFDAIAGALKDDAERKQAIKQVGGIFAFELKNGSGETKTWYVDLKETGAVGTGAAPQGKKPTTTLSLSDENFGNLVAGKAQAQKLFMTGKLKLKGDMMKATKMEPIFKKVQAKAKL